MPYLRANGLNIMFERAGQGEPLLFLGGTGWDLRQRPNPMTSDLIRHFNLICFDQRGMGQTDKPVGPYTMEDYACDALAVMDALELEKAHVVGYSFGGMVAQEMAIRWPERIGSLVLAASAAGGDGGASYPIHEFIDLAPFERAHRGIEVADLRFTRKWQLQHPEKAEQRIRDRVAKQSEFSDEPGALEGMKAQLEARANHNTFDRLPDIKSRTLVLAGRYDGQATLEAQQKMQHQIPNSEIKVLPGSHGFLYESNDVYEEIIRFCLTTSHRKKMLEIG